MVARRTHDVQCCTLTERCRHTLGAVCCELWEGGIWDPESMRRPKVVRTIGYHSGQVGAREDGRMEKRGRRCHCPWEASEQRKSQVRPPRMYLAICGFSQYPPKGSTARLALSALPLISALPSHTSPLFPFPIPRAPAAPQPSPDAHPNIGYHRVPVGADIPLSDSSRRSLGDPLNKPDLRPGLSLSKSSPFSGSPILLLTTASCCFHYILQHTVPGPRLVSIERSN